MKSQVPNEIEEKIIGLKADYYSKGSIVRAITKQSGSKEQAKYYVETVLKETKQRELDDPQLVKQKAKSDVSIGLSLIVTGFVIGLVISLGFALIIAGFVYLLLGGYHYLQYKKNK